MKSARLNRRLAVYTRRPESLEVFPAGINQESYAWRVGGTH